MIDYLDHAHGRMLSPQYWAGLVIMGDMSPVAVSKKQLPWYWLLPWIVVGFFALFLLHLRRSTAGS